MEVFRKIEGYDNKYSVSNNGCVINDKTKRILKHKILRDDYEYEYVTLTANYQKNKTVIIYELMADAFVTNKQVFTDIIFDDINHKWIPTLMTNEGIIINLGIAESEEDAQYEIELFRDIVNK